MTYFAIYCAGGWFTATAMKSAEPNKLIAGWAAALWPIFWVAVAGIFIRAALLKARERAIAEGRKRFGA